MGKRMSGSVLLLTALAFSLIVGDVLVWAAQDPQNPPATPQTTTPQTKTAKPRTKKSTRGQMKTTTPTGDQTMPADPNAATPTTEPTQTTEPAQPAMPARTMAAQTPTEQPDLSGTYTGTFNCDALGLTGDTTLTITGNQFTTADGKTGRIVASKSRGYTAVALQTGDVGTGATPTAPTIVSLRARKSGNRLTLTSAAGSTMLCSFGPSRNVARSRRSRQTPPAATGTEVSNPATTTPPTQPTQPAPENPMPAQTPSPSPSPTPSGSPTPNPSPTPSGSPTPNPSPSPSGSPSPEPNPTITPSPTPSPKPGRPRG